MINKFIMLAVVYYLSEFFNSRLIFNVFIFYGVIFMDIEKINKSGYEIRKMADIGTFPVAIKLIKEGEKIPDGFKKLEKQMRHCQIVNEVRKFGKFYVTEYDDYLCKMGAAALGLGELSEKVKSGDFYFNNLKHFKTHEAAKKTIDNMCFLPKNSTIAVLYAPLEKATFKPDVVLFICTPKKAMILTQSILYENGGRMNASFSGKQSICSDAVACVIKENEPNITIGCNGCRKYAEIDNSEMILSIPGKDIENIREGLCVFSE